MIPEYLHRYFEWVLEQVPDPSNEEYTELFWYLFDREFVWTVAMDENRAADAQSLRERYLEETGQEDEPVGMDLTIRPVSVLEVLVALAVRIETDIMGEPGNLHPEKWFWEMLHNLDLDVMNNDKYYKAHNKEIVADSIDIFIGREYSGDGSGSLFPLEKPFTDMRTMEIWSQMQAYLNEKYPIE